MIEYFARHPTAANLMMVALVAMGLLSMGQLQRETFPDITPSEVQVRVIYPGATAEEVEEAVCQRIEDAIDGVRFVKELRADAREGLATVTAEMEEGGDFTTFLSDVKSEIDAIDDFPDDIEEPIVSQLGTTDPVLALVVSAPTTTPNLKAYCEQLKDRLQLLPGISLVKIGGFFRPSTTCGTFFNRANALWLEHGRRGADRRTAERRFAGRIARNLRTRIPDPLRRATAHASGVGRIW